MDQLHTSLPHIPAAVCDFVDCSDPARIVPDGVVRRALLCIDIAYNVLERKVLVCTESTQVSPHTRRMARRRSIIVLASFTAALLVAFAAPRVAFGLICCALILHLRPEAAPGNWL
ncbi:MAG TPA: hypothetical protein VFE22_05545 [Edaphobacter sp.]|jgi:hypothetical protein|nr:hypothetical protein [Edaphobacter sp.]